MLGDLCYMNLASTQQHTPCYKRSRTLGIPREHIMRQPQQLACVLGRGLAHRQALMDRMNLLAWDGYLRSGRSTGHTQSACTYSWAWQAPGVQLPVFLKHVMHPPHLPVFHTRISCCTGSNAEPQTKSIQ